MLVQGRLLTDPNRPPEPGWLRVHDGRIAEIGTGDPPERPNVGGPDRIVCPGFIDAHVHWPQIDSIGYDGMGLLDWLRTVIYPAEGRWSDPAVATDQALRAVSRLAQAGTLGCAAYLTSHPTALAVASIALIRVPIRVIAGRVLMDVNAPASLLFRPDAAEIAVDRLDAPRAETSINPRFALSCSAELLESAGRAAAGRCVQTHLAETVEECREVARLFPDDASYTHVYDRFGLLGPRTLLAHAVHLSPDQWRLIADRRAVVVHCPGANLFLEAGLFDWKAALDAGVRVALGSDIAAGPDVAMPCVARRAIEVAKARRMTVAPRGHVPTPADVWHLITRGNADALGWSEAGRLETGAHADILILRAPFEPDEQLVGRLIYNWRDDLIEARLVAGRVWTRPAQSETT